MKRALLFTLAGLTLATTAMADIVDMRIAMHRKDKFSPTKTIANACDSPATTTIEPNYSPNWNSTTTVADPLPCTDYTVTGPAPGPSQIYIVIGQGPAIGISGVSFGIDFNGRAGQQNGVDPSFTSWVACADGLQFPNDGGFGDFPAPKGGTRITWTLPASCSRQEIGGIGVHAVIGSLYVYAYAEDVVRVTPNNNLLSGAEVVIADCAGVETNLSRILAEAGIDTFAVLGRVHLGGDGSQGYTPCGVVPVADATWGKIKAMYAK